MIRRIEALNYRCLRFVRQDLDEFHVLVGPNSSGKTTFLDVVAFLGDLITGGLEKSVGSRTNNYEDLFWNRQGSCFELAVALEIPEKRRQGAANGRFSFVRYEVTVGVDEATRVLGILAERVVLCKNEGKHEVQRALFPTCVDSPETLQSPKGKHGTKTIVNKIPGGNDNFYAESEKSWDTAFKLGAQRSALANLPEDESKFPVATWLRAVLVDGTQALVLNSSLMRKTSPPGKGERFSPDGSNLPWVIQSLKRRDKGRFHEWIQHLRTALSDIADVHVTQRPDDKHCYLSVEFAGGLKVPSWMLSDGTLRLMALTIPAYLPALDGVFLIEEPENGIHPRAVQTLFDSLSSVYDAQVLMATHSPVILSLARPESVLCFAKTEDGATDIVAGNEHPALRDWHGEENLGTMFAGGVLG